MQAWSLKVVICVIASLLAALSCAYLGYYVADSRWQSKWNKQQVVYAKAKSDAQEAARVTEQKYASNMEKVSNDAQAKINHATSAANSATATADSLREQIKRLSKRASSATSNTSSSAERKTARATIDLLSDLLGESIKRNEVMGSAYDRARISGLACESSYDSLRK